MKRSLKVCLIFASAGCLALALETVASAQIVRKTVDLATRDVRETIRDTHDRPWQYSPNDPWYRGKLYRYQTGQYGFFYNCDGEECKRNSPYICWKTHYERSWPRPQHLIPHIREEIENVKWRIANGSCHPREKCSTCRSTNCQCGHTNGGCATGQCGTPTGYVDQTLPAQPPLEVESLGVIGQPVAPVRETVPAIERAVAVDPVMRPTIGAPRGQASSKFINGIQLTDAKVAPVAEEVPAQAPQRLGANWLNPLKSVLTRPASDPTEIR